SLSLYIRERSMPVDEYFPLSTERLGANSFAFRGEFSTRPFAREGTWDLYVLFHSEPTPFHPNPQGNGFPAGAKNNLRCPPEALCHNPRQYQHRSEAMHDKTEFPGEIDKVETS